MSEWGTAEWVSAIGFLIILLFSGAAWYAVLWISKVQTEAAEKAEKEAAEKEKQKRMSDGRYDKVTFIEAAGESEDGTRNG